MLIALIVLGAIVLIVLAWWVARSGSASPRTSGLPPVPQTEEGVKTLVGRGDKIKAIKLLRHLSGLGLKEAKDAVDEFERSGRLPSAPALPAPTARAADNDPVIRQLAAEGRLVDAIGRYRELSGVGLAEAKDAVERISRGGR
jgi:ribosomal protein L7/L12